MSVMGGLAAAMALREAGPWRPIVALTANVLPEGRLRCEASGRPRFAGKAICEMPSETFAASAR